MAKIYEYAQSNRDIQTESELSVYVYQSGKNFK